MPVVCCWLSPLLALRSVSELHIFCVSFVLVVVPAFPSRSLCRHVDRKFQWCFDVWVPLLIRFEGLCLSSPCFCCFKCLGALMFSWLKICSQGETRSWARSSLQIDYQFFLGSVLASVKKEYQKGPVKSTGHVESPRHFAHTFVKNVMLSHFM